MPQTMPLWVDTLARELATYGAEARHDALDRVWWISVPIEDSCAIEVEEQDPGEYNVMARAWDRTHGLASETLLASCRTPDVAAYVVAGVIARHEDNVRKLEAMLSADLPDWWDAEVTP